MQTLTDRMGEDMRLRGFAPKSDIDSEPRRMSPRLPHAHHSP